MADDDDIPPGHIVDDAADYWEETANETRYVNGEAQDRPELVFTPDNAIGTVDLAIKLLAPLRIYQRGPSLVHVRCNAGEEDRATIRRDGAPQIVLMGTGRLAELVETAARWRKARRKRDGSIEKVPCLAPAAVVQRIADRREWDHVRPLRGISRWPLLRPDGTVAFGPSYDAATQYIISRKLEAAALPATPTWEDAKRACAELLEVVADFPFQSDVGRAAWLAALLTLIARALIDGPLPLWYIDANEIGSGKTLLAQLIGWILAGRPIPPSSAPVDEEEWAKTLMALAIAGDPIVLYDNLKAKLGGAELEKVLTSTEYSARLLGKNEAPTYPFQTMLIATANNGTVSEDLTRRALHIRLEAKEERPAERVGFRHDPIEEWVLSERSRLIRAILVILRAYHMAGSPDVSMRPMGSYGAWSRAVRAPLIWCGLPDPADSQAQLREIASPDADKATELFAAWRGVHGDTEVTASQLVKSIQFPDSRDAMPEEPAVTALRDAVQALCDSPKGIPTASGLGSALRSLRGKRRGGLVLQSAADTHAKTQRWRLVPC